MSAGESGARGRTVRKATQEEAIPANDKFQPGEEMFDEVTGHASSNRVVGHDEDTEGHGARIKI